MAAPQDISRPIFEDLLSRGYVDTQWETNPGATDGPCLVKNGDRLPLAELIAGLVHDAPIYEKTHVGCKCQVIVSGPDLPDIVVNAFGIVSGELPEKQEEPPVEEPPVEPVEGETPPPEEGSAEKPPEGA